MRGLSTVRQLDNRFIPLPIVYITFSVSKTYQDGGSG